MHRHADAYAAIVLSGGYEEVGSNGRFHVGPGEVLLHHRFDAHFNRFERSGARLLNLPLRTPVTAPLGRIDDPDQLVRMVEIDANYASIVLERRMRPITPQLRDWPDILAQDLIADPAIRLDWWARDHGLAPATISRGFRKAFGVSAVAFRAEARTRRAFRQISHAKTSLALVAAEACFADQAHMSRAIKAMTGRSPGWWAKVK
jgi:AraC-like DNA-binding protein